MDKKRRLDSEYVSLKAITECSAKVGDGLDYIYDIRRQHITTLVPGGTQIECNFPRILRMCCYIHNNNLLQREYASVSMCLIVCMLYVLCIYRESELGKPLSGIGKAQYVLLQNNF